MVVHRADCVVVRNCRELTRNCHKYSVQKLFLKNSCIFLIIPDHLNVRLRTNTIHRCQTDLKQMAIRIHLSNICG